MFNGYTKDQRHAGLFLSLKRERMQWIQIDYIRNLNYNKTSKWPYIHGLKIRGDNDESLIT